MAKDFFHKYRIFLSCFVFIFIGFLIPSLCISQSFKRYGVKDGLSQSSVYAMLQDSHGFMWFATGDGLNRFDGYSFKKIKPQNNSGSTRYFENLFEDSEGNIWCGSYGALFRFNYKTEVLQNVLSDTILTNAFAYYVAGQDQQKNIWAANSNGDIIKFNLSSQRVFHIASIRKQISRPFKTECIAITTNNCLLIGSNESVLEYNFEKHSFRFIKNEEGKNFPVIGISSAGKKFFYLCGGDVKLYNSETKKITSIKKGDLPTSASYNCVSQKNIFYIAKFADGLEVYDSTQKKVIARFQNAENDESSICFNVIHSLYIDRQNQLWIGSEGGGLSVLDLNKKKFQLYSIKTGAPFSSDFGRCYFKDKYERIWHGTHDKGINIYDRKNNSCKTITAENNSLSGNLAATFFRDSKNRIWIGGDVYAAFTDDDVSKITQVPLKNTPQLHRGSNFIMSFFEIGNSLFACTKGGVYQLQDAGFFSMVYPCNALTGFYDKDENKVWIGNEDSGVNCLLVKNFNARILLSVVKTLDTPINVRCILKDFKSGHFFLEPQKELLNMMTNKINLLKQLMNHQVLQIIMFMVCCKIRLTDFGLALTKGFH